MLRPVTVLALLGLSGSAFAHPHSIVAGGQDPDATDPASPNGVDVLAELDYAYELSTSTVIRERIDPDADHLSGTRTVRDLEYQQFRHVLTPRLQLGIFRDTFIYGALPIVITQARELRFIDNSNRAGSSTVADGFLPEQGFDARDPGTPTPGDLAFRGVNRRGLDQVHVGLGTAFMNQLSDPTKPTWKLGAELRLAVGETMKLDAMSPGANEGVSRGVHELRVWTSFARKLGWAEPWIELFWQAQVAHKSDSLFQDPGFGAVNPKHAQLGGVAFGLEVYALDQKADQTRISVDLGSKAIAHFEGREYTEMWEVFAVAGDSDGIGPLVLDADPIEPDVQPLSHPGISNIENYLELTGQFAIRAQIGPHVRFAVIADLVWKTDHVLSFADAGVDRDDDNELVNPGTDEVNPFHDQNIDLVGHRYRSEDGFDIVLGVQGQVLF